MPHQFAELTRHLLAGQQQAAPPARLRMYCFHFMLLFAGCLPLGATCTANSECCLGHCLSGRCNQPPCFAGDTLVHIREAPAPIPIRDLRTGQHVMCLDTTEDLRAPKKIAYCRVMNWVSALICCCLPASRQCRGLSEQWLEAAMHVSNTTMLHQLLYKTSPWSHAVNIGKRQDHCLC